MISHAAPLDTANLARSLFTAECHSAAILALLLWDFSLLVGDEVEYIWMRQRSLFSLFWFLLRYPIILSHVFVVIAFSSDGWSPEFCVGWMQTKIFLVCIGFFSGRICWCLRTYALWNRQHWLVVLGVPLIILESIVTLYATMRSHHIPIPTGLQQICIAAPEKGVWSALSWIVPFAFDTAMSSLSLVRAIRVSSKLKTPLTTQLIRDGLGYYGLITVIYVMGLVVYFVNPIVLFIMGHTMFGLLNLVSARFLLNLRMLKSEDQEYKSRNVPAGTACASNTVGYGITFGMLTGVEGLIDQFELDDARIGEEPTISMQRTAFGISRTRGALLAA